MNKTFVLVDVSKKQEFIFKSSRLKDNLTNSHIIKSITEYNDSQDYSQMDVSLNSFIKKCKASKVYCGGGNSIISFDSEGEAKDFIRKYSKAVLEKYPDLELYLSMLKKEDNSVFNNDDRKELIKKASELKEKRRSRYEKVSFGIENIDKETGFPMESRKDVKEYEKIVNIARYNLSNILDLDKNSSVEITSQLEEYKAKSKDGVSYMGIISIDGNGMGDLVNKIKDIEALSRFSDEIRRIYFKAVTDYLKQLGKGKSTKEYVTPIVSAGDDLCLIMNGKIAIDAAAKIIENIKKESMESQEIKKITKWGLTACAGVVIVKGGYPFFDAYKEAEKMCKNAKMYLHNIKREDEEYFSVVDWKIVQGSNIEANDFIENIKIKNEKYHIKPLIVDKYKSYYESTNNTYIFSYHDFKSITNKIKDMIKENKISRSTLKRLQESFYDGFESYKIDIEARRKEHTEELFKIIMEHFSDKNIENELGVIKTPFGENIYLLNDIIDSLKFLTIINSN